MNVDYIYYVVIIADIVFVDYHFFNMLFVDFIYNINFF